MRRILLSVLFLLLAFYVAWPATTAWRINGALKLRDAGALERRIDFPSVRESMRPAVARKVGEIVESYQQQAGPTGALLAQALKGDVTAKLVDASLATLVTSDNLIRLANDTGPAKDRIERIIREQIGQVPGLSAPAATAGGTAGSGGAGTIGNVAGRLGIDPGRILGGIGGQGGAQPQQAPAKAANGAADSPAGRTYGFSNVKHFAFRGPLGFEVGIAKDQGASALDLVAEMAFRGFDWRLVGLRPRM